MSRYYIKEVSATGDGKTKSLIEFGPHLNIIHGESNTGKTIIANSILFAFGGDVSNELFDPDRTGYTTVGMKLTYLDKYEISFERVIGDRKFVAVSSNCPEIKGGNYLINRNKRDTSHPVLNDLILRIVGINETPMVGVKQTSEKEHLSWRSLFKSLYLNKDMVDSTSSPILPNDTNIDYRILAAILYFITGTDHAEDQKTLSAKEKITRKNAVESFVNSQIKYNEPRLVELQKELEEYGDLQDLDNHLSSLEKAIRDTSEMIEKTGRDIENIVFKRQALEEKIAESETLQKRYSVLNSQYIADIERLNFIVEGEDILFSAPKPEKCPFCGGALEEKQKESCIDAAKAELIRIIRQVDGLQTLERTLSEEIYKYREERDNLVKTEKEYKTTVIGSLKAKYESLTSKSRSVQEYLKIKSEYDYLNGIKEQLPKVLETYKDPEDSGSKRYNPKDHFEKDFSEKIDEYLTHTLRAIGYPVKANAHLNLKTFNIEVDGNPKSNNQGQGFCSLFNSALFLSLHYYYCNDAVFNPNLLMIDTPLLGLEEWSGTNSYSKIRDGFFQYLYDNRNIGQVIIIDNQEELPKLDYIGGNVRVVEFTKGRRPGRYGYLEDYRQ